ncbi:MAG: phenylalanine--tRNA ligase subunit alpha [Candidatus Glassbacteria bacterium RBG_16_58_8]|uniref:Phenylalanine--tRNA ligase alpha subunit n=1 Tax=Candidatus Glassbacteria bacterium RBG_16_58_8 TaxID=1817866 RepID=A0A1F5YC71_9BACT|nr:MAG: phenylalanine--tRNA ligase subunit alpha [Candidatus Glassbacteria bacterium RBG_16_58_8]
MQTDRIDHLEAIATDALKEIEKASSREDLEAVRVRYLGRKGRLTDFMRRLGEIPPEERPEAGKRANAVKARVGEALDERIDLLNGSTLSRKLIEEEADPTLPGIEPWIGSYHPISLVFREIVEIFHGMGFSVARGPEVELDYYNFEALNFPKDHPTRDMQDTFYLSDDVVMRTHTSPVQVRVMEKVQPPLRIIVPGRVFRCDSPDASHSPVFHQVEGLYVDRNVTFPQLKGCLDAFAKGIFGPHVMTRFRPSFFPFTEPSAEVDISCIFCGGAGCRVCKRTGWLEILGSGMVDPAVFEAVGYDPEIFTGYAFGMGVERIAMLKYGINDIRLFYENDTRFLSQF